MMMFPLNLSNSVAVELTHSQLHFTKSFKVFQIKQYAVHVIKVHNVIIACPSATSLIRFTGTEKYYITCEQVDLTLSVK